MSTQTTPSSRTVNRVISHLLRDPMKFQTYRNLCYLLVMGPLGSIYFALLVTGLLTGFMLVIVVIGIPILVLVLALVVGLARFERILLRVLLRVDIPSTTVETTGGFWGRLKHLVTDRQTWKATVYLLSEFIYGSIVAGTVGSIMATAVSFLFAPIYYTQARVVAYGPIPSGEFTLDVVFGWDNLLIGLTTTFQLGTWQIETLLGAVLVAGLGLALLLVVFPVANALAWIWGQYAQVMLTVPRYWRFSTR